MNEDKAKMAVDKILERIIPVREATLQRAELLFEAGDGKGAQEVLAEGLKEVACIINNELLKHTLDIFILEPLKETLGIKS